MRLFIDTDILLDVLLEREGHFEASAGLPDSDYRKSPIKAVPPGDAALFL